MYLLSKEEIKLFFEECDRFVLLHKANGRNLSDKSVEAYKQSLKVYLEFLESKKGIANEKVNFDSFTRDNIKEFIVWLMGKNCSAKTINLRLTAIRSFLKYSSEEDFELRGVYTDICSINV